MFPLSPNSYKNEDSLSIFFFFSFACQCFVPGLQPLLFIYLLEREMDDSKERMCSCNDTRLTALKLKSFFNFLSRVWEASKEVPEHCLTPVLADSGRE